MYVYKGGRGRGGRGGGGGGEEEGGKGRGEGPVNRLVNIINDWPALV